MTYLITPGDLTPETFSELRQRLIDHLRVAISAGISAIQLRERSLPTKLLVDLAAEVVSMARGSETKIFINERADVAKAAGAAGVHLRSDSMPCAAVRRSFPSLLIGVSTHSLSEIKVVMKSGADLAVFGPVFETPGKGEPVGLAELARVSDAVRPFPVLGLGGVDASNYPGVLHAGAAGFAAIRLFADATALKRISKELYEH